MTGMTAFEKIGQLPDDIVNEYMDWFESSTIFDQPKRKSAFVRFMASGWGVAVICAFVGLGVLMSIVWAGWHAPDGPTVPMGGSEANSENAVITEPPLAESETLAEGTAEASTEIPTETVTEGVLYDPITEGGLTFVSKGDGTCSVNAADTTLSGAVTVPETSPYGDLVTTIASFGFHNCRAITSITLPDSVKVINNGAFRGCNGLVSIRMPETMTSMGPAVFQQCTKLTSITMPRGIEILPPQTFETCTELTSVEFGEGLTKIASSAFNGCSSLAILRVPATLQSVGNSAFLNCCGLSRIYFGGTREQWEAVSVHKIGNSQFLSAPVTTLD